MSGQVRHNQIAERLTAHESESQTFKLGIYTMSRTYPYASQAGRAGTNTSTDCIRADRSADHTRSRATAIP